MAPLFGSGSADRCRFIVQGDPYNETVWRDSGGGVQNCLDNRTGRSVLSMKLLGRKTPCRKVC